MAFRDFLNSLKIQKCFEKAPVSRVNTTSIAKVVIDRWLTMLDFISTTIFYKFVYTIQYSEVSVKEMRLTFIKL